MWLESRPFPRWPVARGAQLGGVDGFDRPVSCNVLNPFQAFGSGDAWCLNGGGVWGAAPVSFGVSCRVYDSLEILGGSAETLGRLQSSGRRSCKVRRGTGSLEGPEERCDEVPNDDIARQRGTTTTSTTSRRSPSAYTPCFRILHFVGSLATGVRWTFEAARTPATEKRISTSFPSFIADQAGQTYQAGRRGRSASRRPSTWHAMSAGDNE